MIRKCRTCDNEIVSDNESDILKEFRLVKTHTGNYYRNVCRSCENKRARELRKANYKTYNYYRKVQKQEYDTIDFGRMYYHGCNYSSSSRSRVQRISRYV